MTFIIPQQLQSFKKYWHSFRTQDQTVPAWTLYWSNFASRCYITMLLKIFTSSTLALLGLGAVQTSHKLVETQAN